MVREAAVEKAKRRAQEKLGEKLSLPENAGSGSIANGALVLASDESRTVTGSKLVMDCGYMAH
ncbi:MAG: SDR family oxidoreductase [Ruminococcaceae bacterium]|nr:SDR family oxidoreductase [Oscillospiraceae bacterium]